MAQGGRDIKQTIFLGLVDDIVVEMAGGIHEQGSDLAVGVIKPDGGIHRLHLLVFGRGLAVAAHDAFHAEGLEVGHVAEVAAVGCHALALPFHENAFVGPFPDKSTEHPGVTVDLVPVFLEVAEGIAHGMGIFAGDHGALVGGVAGDGEQTFPTGVLRTFHVVVSHTGVEVFVLGAGIEP